MRPSAASACQSVPTQCDVHCRATRTGENFERPLCDDDTACRLLTPIVLSVAPPQPARPRLPGAPAFRNSTPLYDSRKGATLEASPVDLTKRAGQRGCGMGLAKPRQNLETQKPHAHTPNKRHATLQIWGGRPCTAHANGHGCPGEFTIATPLCAPSRLLHPFHEQSSSSADYYDDATTV